MKTLWILPLLSGLFLLSGCGEETDIYVYEVKKTSRDLNVPLKEVPKPQEADANQAIMPALAKDVASFGMPEWDIPGHWDVRDPGAMRKGSFVAMHDGQQAEIAVSVFPGDVGGLMANVNRWAGQINAPELTEAQIEALPRDTVEGNDVVWVSLQGPEQALYAAVVTQGGGTWFYKMTGAAQVVAQEQLSLEQLVRSTQF